MSLSATVIATVGTALVGQATPAAGPTAQTGAQPLANLATTAAGTTSPVRFAFDPAWWSVLTSPFMQNALLAGVLISLAAGFIGYFTIARRSSFAAHALGHIGLPGATGAVLLGLPVSLGLGVFAVGGALAIGALGKKASQREVATGTILAFALGLGMFFSRLSSAASQQMQSILFGSILSVTPGQLIGVAIFDAILLGVLAVCYRPLLFSSVDEQVAQAKGVNITLMNIIFMALLAGVITISVQAVGTLLIFALIITPAAAANSLAHSPLRAMLTACLICLACIWGGIVVSAMFPTPPSFVIVSLSTLVWAVTRLAERQRR